MSIRNNAGNRAVKSPRSLNNIAVFKDTEKICKSDSRIKEDTKVSVQNQKVILEDESLSQIELNIYTRPSKIIVSKKRSFEAAKAYIGQKVAVHNFASATNPGGGVIIGSSAQEECLCRCSNLYFCLDTYGMWDRFYKPHRKANNPINNGDVIYTPDVCVFKTDTSNPELMEESEWYKVDVITCAAPNLRKNPTNKFNAANGDAPIKLDDEVLRSIHEKRLSRMLDIAVQNGVETIILGAFGCGAFKNNPDVVAEAAASVIPKYVYAFKNIEFAVYCPPKDDKNFDTFRKRFDKIENKLN